MKDLHYLTDSYDKGIKRILEIDAPLKLFRNFSEGMSIHCASWRGVIESITVFFH